jgi:hypothetical protein
VNEKAELNSEKIYYLYYREKAIERCLSPSMNGEESKKVRIHSLLFVHVTLTFF